MSQLDEILSKAASSIATGVVTGEWGQVNTKQDIKDLMLELIGEDEFIKDTYDDHSVEVANYRNLVKQELRQKVEAL